MASVIKRKGSSKWIAQWYEGKKICRKTTGIDIIPTDGSKPAVNKRLAEQIADAMEAAARKGASGRTLAAALRAAAATVDDTPILTAREYLESYEPSGGVSNRQNARRAVERFLAFLSARNMDALALTDVKRKHCEAFLGEQVQRVTEGTVKVYRDHLTCAFNKAIQAELIDRNPFSLTRMADVMNQYAPELKGNDKTERERFTVEQLKTMLYRFPQPYRDLVAVSVFTAGQRISDCVNLTWGQVDFENGRISIQAQKTGRKGEWCLLPELRARLEARRAAAPDGFSEYVFPDLAELHRRSNGYVSTRFQEMLRAFGILKDGERKQRKGERRNVSTLCFHSIRHTAPSLMQEMGVPQATTMELTGHDSRAIHELYTSISPEARAAAMNKLAEAVRPADDTSPPTP